MNDPTPERVEIDSSTDSGVLGFDYDTSAPDGQLREAGGAAVSYADGVVDSTPFVGDVWGAGSSIYDAITGDKSVEQALGEVMGDATSFTGNAFGAMLDPVGAVAGWVLDVILALIPPLEWLLEQVTGSPGEMEDRITLWEHIAAGLNTIAEDIEQDITSVSDWEGSEADTDRSKIYELGAAIAAITHECGGLQEILAIAKLISELIQEAIKGIISGFMSRQLVNLAIAWAAAAPSFGSSLVQGKLNAFIDFMTCKLQAVQQTTHATTIFQKLLKLLSTAGEFLVENGIEAAFRASSNITHSGGEGASDLTIREGSVAIINTLVMEQEADFLCSLGDSSEEVASAAHAATSDGMTWGILFTFFADKNNQEANNVLEQIQAARDALTGRADLLSNSAADWDEIEAELKSVFEDLDEAALEGEGVTGSTTSEN